MAPILRSERLTDAGIPHGFSLRSCGPGAPESGAPERLDDHAAQPESARHWGAERDELARAVGFSAGHLYELTQVHGNLVIRAHASDDPAAFRRRDGDALVGTETGLTVGVKTADCLPLLLADPISGAVAAVHAGWRGVAAGVVQRAVATLLASAAGWVATAGPTVAAHRGAGNHTGTPGPDRLIGAIMPHIRSCCFEVGRDVADTLANAAPGADAIVGGQHGDRPRVALASLVMAQLHNAGVRPAYVDDVQGCTMCDSARFHSYRRDGQQAGRHYTVIVAGVHAQSH